MAVSSLLAILGLCVAASLPNSAAPDVVRRADADRRIDHEDPVIARALAVIGQPLNPVFVIGRDEIRAIYARAGVGRPRPDPDAFRSPADARDPAIYVSRESTIYRAAARTGATLDLLKLAATLVHEQVHNTDREFAACRLEADFLRYRMRELGRADRGAAQRHLVALEARALAFDWAERRRSVAGQRGLLP